MYYYRI